MQNLEQKFRCTDLKGAEERAVRLGAADRGLIRQHDIFFLAPHARLKLRILEDAPAELISYRRANQAEARTSEYHITHIAEVEQLVETLGHALGRGKSLKKVRHLYLFKATRIHLDTIDGLGTFVELETVITTQSMAEAQAELDQVVGALGLGDPITTAYVELLPG